MHYGESSKAASQQVLEGIRSARWFVFLVVNMAAMTVSQRAFRLYPCAT